MTLFLNFDSPRYSRSRTDSLLRLYSYSTMRQCEGRKRLQLYKGPWFTRRPDAPSLTCLWGRATSTHTVLTTIPDVTMVIGMPGSHRVVDAHGVQQHSCTVHAAARAIPLRHLRRVRALELTSILAWAGIGPWESHSLVPSSTAPHFAELPCRPTSDYPHPRRLCRGTLQPVALKNFIQSMKITPCDNPNHSTRR